jgi:Zn-dependent protease with chaperone function
LDFFEEQDRRRRNTRTLVLAFGLALVAVDIVVYLVCAVGLTWVRREYGGLPIPGFRWWNGGLFLWVSVAVTAVVTLESLRMRRKLASGGGAVAVLLDGDLILENPGDPGEKKILNVVEEMAVASATPVPLVFVLNRQERINAFAAGYTASDAAIGVTKGCVDLLTRDELQGVVAHEFAHIRNGDMRLNLQMVSVLHGLLGVHTAGKLIARGPGFLPFAGAIIVAAGWLGVFFGKLIRLAVSRQCEFRADAEAVQYTRNAWGLGGALKKIGGGGGSRIHHPYAETMNHLFIANGVRAPWLGIFATHPPLEERVRKLDPGFDGIFPRVVPPAGAEHQVRMEISERRIPVIPAAEVAARLGKLTPAHLAYAAAFLEDLGAGPRAELRDPSAAEELVYALLLDAEEEKRGVQLQWLSTRRPGTGASGVERWFSFLGERRVGDRLPWMTLALPGLRKLGEDGKRTFLENVEGLVRMDGRVSVFEFAAEKVLKRSLLPPGTRGVQFYAMKPLLPDAEVLLSLLAYAGQSTEESAKQAFASVGHFLGPWSLGLVPKQSCSFDLVERALDRVALSAPGLKRKILTAASICVTSDGKITLKEAELLRALAAGLDTPIPDLMVAE